jgi:hypothetical protein
MRGGSRNRDFPFAGITRSRFRGSQDNACLSVWKTRLPVDLFFHYITTSCVAEAIGCPAFLRPL